jgi:hypothetical protein
MSIVIGDFLSSRRHEYLLMLQTGPKINSFPRPAGPAGRPGAPLEKSVDILWTACENLLTNIPPGT